MDNFTRLMKDAFSYDPVSSVIFVAAFALLTLLSVDYVTMKNNQTHRMVSSRIGKSSSQKSWDIMGVLLKFFSKEEDKIALQLKQANVLFTTKEYMTFKTVGMGIGIFVGLVMSPLGIIFETMMPGSSTAMQELTSRVFTASVLGYLGSFVPKLWLILLIGKRRKLLGSQLQDALLNIADALKSGHVIQEAIRIVGLEMSYPIGPEFSKANREMETGKTLESALEDLRDRVSLEDFTMAVNAILIQYEVGGKLEPLLRNMVKIITERAELKKEIEKTIANSKTVGYVLLAAPWFFVVIFSMMNKDTYLEMLRNPIGILMLGAALLSYIIAACIIIYIIRDVSKEV